jgi:hypothetical protein
MRRLWIILLVGLLAAAVVAPAAAAKGKPQPPPPEVKFYDVTMRFIEGAEGFSTEGGCLGAGVTSVRMQSTDGGRSLSRIQGTPFLLTTRLGPDIQWYRYYPYYPTVEAAAGFNPNDYPANPRLTGSTLEGCHGDGIAAYVGYQGATKVLVPGPDGASIVPDEGAFSLWLRDGEVELLWHSDYYVQWEKPRKRWEAAVIEDFSYSTNTGPRGSAVPWTWTVDGNPDHPVVWNPATGATGVVAGEVRMTHFSPGVYDPFPGQPRTVRFILTVAPVP